MRITSHGWILLAFSGGPDSVGLAASLRAHAPLLAYVDHRLRGAREARRERARVRAIAARLCLPLVRARVKVGRGGEAAARRERYRVLHALAGKHGCGAVATAHTADDRAETILFNLLRGTGLRGLAAPRPEIVVDGVRRVRPALDERRATLRAHALPFAPVVDPTNRRTCGARARARALLLPQLARVLDEDPVPLLCGLGDLADELRKSLERRAATLADGARRRALLDECSAAFPYLVEALRGDGPPLTSRAYGSLRDFLRAGRTDRVHVTPGGEGWRICGDRVRVSRLLRPRRSRRQGDRPSSGPLPRRADPS